jgi:glucose-1-phosphatase
MIRLFVFDLGNVILPFEHRQIAAKLYERSGEKSTHSPEDIFAFLFDLEKGSVNNYEKGKASSLDFFRELKNRFRLRLSFEEFKDIWNPIFAEDPAVNSVILYLKERGYPLFLLSNTNELHFAYIMERYPIVHVFDELILSFKVGAKKPEKAIYDTIFAKMDVKGHEVFYIDDIPHYVEIAASRGIGGMVFRDAEQLWKLVRDQGI